MKMFELRNDGFYFDGKRDLLLCGEIHYFRMPREAWEPALDRLCESGCNAVAYYVPWLVHEPERGLFDFDGRIHPSNDLRAWIRMTEEKGLLGILRPGPYAYAETANLGVPAWFINNKPNAQVKTYSNGHYDNASALNYVGHNHPDFLEAAKCWYDAVCEVFREHLAPRGNIIMVQLCNEIPGDDHDDDNCQTLGVGDTDGIFPVFLREKYRSAAALNEAYGTEFSCFEEIEPHMLNRANPELAGRERLDFYYRHYYPEYFRRLKGFMEDSGVDTVFMHNAYNPRAVSLHVHNRRQNPWLFISVDCYYSMTGGLGMREATYFCDFGAEYIKSFLRCPPWIVEQECGYWNDFPEVYGPELYIYYIWTIAAGYQGFNLYLFAGGENRPGLGFFGTDHNWQAPVDMHGGRASGFSDILRAIGDIKQYGDALTEPNRCDITLGIKSDPGLIWKEVSKLSFEVYFALKTAGFTPGLCDYIYDSPDEIQKHPALLCVCDETLDEHTQNKLLGYARKGGKLIIFGRVPWLDDMGAECSALSGGAGIKVCPEPFAKEPQEKFIYNGVEYHAGSRMQRVGGGVMLAESSSGHPASMLFQCGNGIILVFPFSVNIELRSTCHGIRLLLEEIGVRPSLSGTVNLRVIPKESGRLIVLNPHPVEVIERFTYGGNTLEASLPPYSFTVLEVTK